MTKQAEYSQEEWQTLIDGPALVGTVIMLAGKSGLGSMKESMAVAAGILSGRTEYSDNELIQGIIESRVKDGMKSTVEDLSSDNPYLSLKPDALLEAVVDRCKDIDLLLSRNSASTEAGEYKQWMVDVGQRVAEAAKEGGFLGIGGERVSETEVDALNQIRSALNV